MSQAHRATRPAIWRSSCSSGGGRAWRTRVDGPAAPCAPHDCRSETEPRGALTLPGHHQTSTHLLDCHAAADRWHIPLGVWVTMVPRAAAATRKRLMYFSQYYLD